jgi:hypothetical protein
MLTTQHTGLTRSLKTKKIRPQAALPDDLRQR